MTHDIPDVIKAWHELVNAPSKDNLRALLADQVVFHSPAVYAPQEGIDLTSSYLEAAMTVLGPTLTYRSQWYADDSAVLQFTAVVDGLDVHGVDIIRWNTDGKIVDFTVLVRPHSALEVLISAMGAELHRIWSAAD